MNAPLVGTIEIPRSGTLTAAARDAYLASLGLAAAAQDGSRKAVGALGERTGRTLATLVRRGAAVDARRAEQVAGLRADVARRVERVTGAVGRVAMPGRHEVRELAASVAALSLKVDALVETLTEMPTPTIEVRAHEEGWAVEVEGTSAPLGVHATKDEAVEAARALAAERAPSHLIVYKKDGTIQDTVTYHA